jgi:hypothetical protein
LRLPKPFCLSFPQGIRSCLCVCPSPSACPSRRESASVFAFALALLSVLPEGNPLLSLRLPKPFCLSFPQGICFRL